MTQRRIDLILESVRRLLRMGAMPNLLNLLQKQHPADLAQIFAELPEKERHAAFNTLVERNGKLAMADPDAVPAGKYGKAALESLKAWDAVAGKVAAAENVRAALKLVETGEAPLGVVYATDAAASQKVRVVTTFPEASHPPIRYPVAVLAASKNPEAEPFEQFLASDAGQAIFARYGFSLAK